MELIVEVFSDVICPWCFVGKRRLEKAIDMLDGKYSVQVEWLPYQLNPDMPRQGVLRSEYRIQKFGSLERSRELEATVVSAGQSEGIRFDFDRIERTPNTLDAHRLIGLASRNGVQDAVVEALFQAYFVDGRDISNTDVLVDVVTHAGLDKAAALALLAGDEGMAEISEASQMSRRLNITGVPFFIINRELALSGAQPAETFRAAFQHAMISG